MKSSASAAGISTAERMVVKEEMSAGEIRNLNYRKWAQHAAYSLLWVSGIMTVVILLLVSGYVILQGSKVIDLAFLTTPPKGGLTAEGGMSTTIITTLYLVGLTILFATPLGIGAAVFLFEYASDFERKTGVVSAIVEVARFGVELLSGVPSIIFGLFGYALFVRSLQFGFSLLSGALAGACLILPVIIRASEEALRSVPRSYREASLGLGATKLETIWGVVLPAATPGIITGIILSVGRVVSETAVFYVTLGGSHNLPKTLLSGGRTMALHVYYLAMDTTAFDKAMGTGAILILANIIINAVINFLSKRLSQGMRAE
jgi:phosphate transport system permease protein